MGFPVDDLSGDRGADDPAFGGPCSACADALDGGAEERK